MGIEPMSEAWETIGQFPVDFPSQTRGSALQNEISAILPPRDWATVSTSEFDASIERVRAQKSEGLRRPALNTEPRNPNPP
jgi:hypothetical protein